MGFRIHCLALLILIISACKQREKSTSLYYWKTTFRLDNLAQETVLLNNVRSLYIRYFDIDLLPGDSIPVPISPLRFTTSPSPLNCIPVIYISNRTFLRLDSSGITGLSKKILQLVGQINKSAGIKTTEIQFYCDWTDKTRSAGKVYNSTMKTIIITGANGNLGKTVTQLFLDRGYHVAAVVSKRTDEHFIRHPNLDIAAVDLMDENAADEYVRSTIKKYGIVYSALLLVGGFDQGNIAATSGEAISKQLSLNFNTAYYIARPVFQHLQQQREGKILFIGARPALVSSAGKELIAYSLSKTLLFKLAEFINEESLGTAVTATVIVPSTIDTPLNRKNMPDADPHNWVSPQQLAEIMEFVVSEKGSALRETVLKVYNNA